MIDRLAEVTGRSVSRETFAQMERYGALLSAASEQHNLIAASTLEGLWERHIVDSAQLVRFEPKPGVSWIDIGSGAGLPGLVIALLIEGAMTLVEPRRLRADFLRQAIDELGLGSRVRLVHGKADRASGKFDVITARAVAPIDRLLGITLHLSHRGTVWLLPKGKSGKSDLADASRTWQGAFRTEASLTDPQAAIVIASGVHAKGRR
jgi:16S rRNA (guanine527-N7)-methyltransferase